MSVTGVQVDRRLTTRDDAAVWVAPIEGGGRSDVAYVLRFTTADEREIAVRLTRGDLVRIRDSAADVLAADARVIDDWLDGAAAAVQRWYSSNGRRPTPRTVFLVRTT